MGIGSHTKPNKGGTDSWITPKAVIDDLGPFDLDPCQCAQQPWKCAAFSYTEREDGLSQSWRGRVWCNPPYSSVWDWMDKLADHGNGTALIFARTEVKGFVKHVWERADAVMFLHGRLFFHHPDGSKATGNSGGPSCLVAYGEYDVMRLRDSKLAGTIVSGW